MKFFLDTANVDEIQSAVKLGMLDGVTTNPSLLAREERSPREILAEICHLVNGPVSAEVISDDEDAMVKEAEELAKIHDNIMVTCPLTSDGLRATRRLAAEGIPVNLTLCFSPAQALLAAKAGAWCVSPFVGRLDEMGSEGMETIRQIVTIYRNYAFNTLVLVSSVRHVRHVVEAALAGAAICTMPASVYDQLVRHPLTEAGLGKFLADWHTGVEQHRATTRPRLRRLIGRARATPDPQRESILYE